jgi:phosphoglycolate phosphatase-like HAD superfamily hydrolase
MIYIFDIDGTLADISHRLHFIQKEPKDWRGFFAACPKDEPIRPVIEIAKALALHHTIIMITGRSDEIEEQTSLWLNEHYIFIGDLLMRKAGDHREDSIVKAELLDRLLRERPGANIAGVFEDRKQVVDMYRAKGLRVFQVAEGNF